MAKVIVLTDDNKPVWQMQDIESWHISALQCQTNVRGSNLAAGIRRAVQDAEAIQAGRDPERLSEKVMRLIKRDASRPGP
jgi:hypothetical protein